MAHRIFQLGVVLCWIASMCWLVVAKILPTVVGGDPPDYGPPAAAVDRPADTWRIRWKENTIGHAASRIRPALSGGTEVHSVVHCEELPLAEMTRQLLGVLAFVAEPLFKDSGGTLVGLRVATRMQFNESHTLDRIWTSVEVGEGAGALFVHGSVDEHDRLHLAARAEFGNGEAELPTIRDTISLPKHALISDSLAPRAELRNLRVGQVWLVPVCRIFPPSGKLQLLQAKVDRHEIVFWDGRDVETKVVEYRADPASNVGAAREVIGREWVDQSGFLLQQEMSFGSFRLRFERTTDGDANPCAQLLDTERHPRLWRTDAIRPEGEE
jgi:hypothetical protein